MTVQLFGPLYVGSLVVFYAVAARMIRRVASEVEDAAGITLDLLALFTFAMTVGASLVYAALYPTARAMGMKGGPAVFLVLLTGYTVLRRSARGLVLDAAAVALPSAFAMAKLACAATGCCYGSPSDLPWAAPSGYRYGAEGEIERHPTQLYDVALSFLIALVVSAVARRRPGRGTSLVVSVLLLALARITTEAFRGDVTPVASLGLTPVQLLLIPVALGSAALLLPAPARTLQGLLASPTPPAIVNETRPRSWLWPALALYGLAVSFFAFIGVAWLRVFGLPHQPSIWPAPRHLWRWLVITSSLVTMAALRVIPQTRPGELANLVLVWSIVAAAWLTAIVAFIRQQAAPVGGAPEPALVASAPAEPEPEPERTEPRPRRERRAPRVRRPNVV